MTKGISMIPATSAEASVRTFADGTARTAAEAIARPSAGSITHRQLRIRGLRVHAEIYGEGEPLLLHSGLWGEAALWRPLHPYLSGYQVIAFDPPGVGRSDMPDLPLTMAGLASVGAGVLDELGIESAHVLGTSFGGAVAQQMAFSHPRRVRRLVLVSTSVGGFSWPGDPAALWLFMQPGTFEQPRLEQVAGTIFGGRMRTEPGLIRSMHIRRPRSILAAIYRMAPLVGWTSLPWLWAIRQPTLLICGDDDPIAPHVNHAIMAMMMRDARLHTVRGGGHLALVDSPAQVAPVIADFLGASVAGAPAAPAAPEPGEPTPVFEPAA
jgi:poly(3-hydroxyoctanoate) depolymerase